MQVSGPAISVPEVSPSRRAWPERGGALLNDCSIGACLYFNPPHFICGAGGENWILGEEEQSSLNKKQGQLDLVTEGTAKI